MTQLTQGSDMELREELRQGSEARHYADRVTPDGRERVEMIPLEWAVEVFNAEQRSIDRAIAERLREIVNFALPDELPSGVDTICASILINTIMERAEQQLSPTTKDEG